MEGKTEDGPPRTLQITDKIRVGNKYGAQLVACYLDDEPEEYAAKIYDPLYYNFQHTMWEDEPRDVTYAADQDYCREVAAYLEMDDQLGGKEVPKYHGSWTFQMPLDLPDGTTTRDVRMILMERIHGQSMVDVKPDPYPEAVRLDTVARVVEAKQYVRHAGVVHNDFAQRNVMLCDGDAENTIGRVVIIDFNVSIVVRLVSRAGSGSSSEKKKREKPSNPLDRWFASGFYGGFGNWLPESWQQRLRPFQEWAYDRWNGAKEFRAPTMPLEWDEENKPRLWISW